MGTNATYAITGHAPTGANIWDWLPSLSPKTRYASAAEAITAVRNASLGPDGDGFEPEWEARREPVGE
jgi:hypothetical protein